MKRFIITLLAALLLPAAAVSAAAPQTFTLESILGYPFPVHLVSGAQGRTIAYILDERGVRNIFVASAPGYTPQKVTNYTADDGQELTNLHVSRDGKYVVYVRGGDHDANWPPTFPPDPGRSPVEQQIAVWSVPTDGSSKPIELGDGDTPAISPDSRRVAFVAQDGSVLWAPIDGSAKAGKLFFDEGQDSDLQWSPDGTALAFVSTRTDHSFIGIYRNDSTPLEFLAPTTSQDVEPRWSPGGTRIAYIRMPGSGGPPVPDFAWWTLAPWTIWVGDVHSGGARRVWQSASTMRASFPYWYDPDLRWTNANRLTFISSADNWPHLYAVSPAGGSARLLTPGKYMVEDTALSSDGRSIVYSANTGRTPGDFDRRHLFSVDIAGGKIRELTAGASSEWSPVIAQNAVAFIRATAQQPPLVSIVASSGGTPRALDRNQVPASFPQSQLVVPRSVSFRASDGLLVHGQLFEPRQSAGKHAAVIYVHGGPPRQMLTTWHYMDYYTDGYAVNQYLASRGFVVLAVNYRLSVGYGFDYAHPAHWGPTGASEYKDVVAGNTYLRTLPSVDGKRIGIWGGSYGGYLTALALARNSDLFCAGVDWHGVHDWSTSEDFPAPPVRYEQVNVRAEQKLAWESSPDSSVSKWRSPVLLVQGDDDHNVRFHQTVDLARRLDLQHVAYSELVLPNEIHGFLRYNSFLRADTATAGFLQKHLSEGSCK